MPRYKYNRRDGNEQEIVEYVEKYDPGYELMMAPIGAAYDRYAFHKSYGFVAFVEFKTKLGSLTPSQIGHRKRCKGRDYVVARTPEECVKGLDACLEARYGIKKN